MKLQKPSPDEVIAASLTLFDPKKIAVVSSFGAESAVLLHMVSKQDPDVPVVFIDTGRHFRETIAYRDRLRDVLGLTDLRVIHPPAEQLQTEDPQGTLHAGKPDRCCHIRKVVPMRDVTSGFNAWFTGRKRYQARTRSGLPFVELVDGKMRVNPLAGMSETDISDYFVRHDLPIHPLALVGYPSIGCEPCTSPATNRDKRSGRWAGISKTECGIHSDSRFDDRTVRAMRTMEAPGR